MPEAETEDAANSAKTSRRWTVVLAILGGLLLLPGACGVVFTGMALTMPDDPYVGAVYMVSIPSIVIGALGGWLLWWAVRKYRARAG
jgi:protein-S-isoprenylcysteine O-methyltransferase Ste14